MATLGTESFWDDLLLHIEDRRVIPIIGYGLVTVGEEKTPLNTWLAPRLAEKLEVDRSKLPEGATLSEVVCAHLLNGGTRSSVYPRVKRLLKDESIAPPESLRQLASITHFNLFITTTFDDMLERAIAEVRFQGKKAPPVYSYYPESRDKDLPDRKERLREPTVYHMLGKVSSQPEYVVWEEDALEFICSINRHLPHMENLARDLQENHLLVMGSNFGDWLVRMFLHVAKQRRLSDESDYGEIVAEGGFPASRSMVLYFSGIRKRLRIVECQPAEFVAELARRWREEFGDTVAAGEPVAAAPGQRPPMPKGAIFISYAREDIEAVRQLKADLEKAGVLVWFDIERLQPGVDYENELEDAVKKHCSYFISAISRTTESTAEAYYHKERHWAKERAQGFAEGEVFYVPVVVDESPLEARMEPRLFRTQHAVRLSGGKATDEFISRMLQLQEHYREQHPG